MQFFLCPILMNITVCTAAQYHINNIIQMSSHNFTEIKCYLSVCSVHSSERLEKEKEELRVALDDALQKLQDQHQKDLAELELRLQGFYQAEWDRVHLTYQEEADKCKSLMRQQVCLYATFFNFFF